MQGVGGGCVAMMMGGGDFRLDKYESIMGLAVTSMQRYVL